MFFRIPSAEVKCRLSEACVHLQYALQALLEPEQKTCQRIEALGITLCVTALKALIAFKTKSILLRLLLKRKGRIYFISQQLRTELNRYWCRAESVNWDNGSVWLVKMVRSRDVEQGERKAAAYGWASLKDHFVWILCISSNMKSF